MTPPTTGRSALTSRSGTVPDPPSGTGRRSAGVGPGRQPPCPSAPAPLARQPARGKPNDDAGPRHRPRRRLVFKLVDTLRALGAAGATRNAKHALDDLRRPEQQVALLEARVQTPSAREPGVSA